jgi:hypothetical protein
MNQIKFKTNRCQFDLKFEKVYICFYSEKIRVLRFYVGNLYINSFQKDIDSFIRRVNRNQDAIPKKLKQRLEDLYFKQSTE